MPRCMTIMLAAGLGLGVLAQAGDAPLLEYDFGKVQEGIIPDPGGRGASITLGKGARSEPGGPEGQAALHFDGSAASASPIAKGTAEKQLPGDEVSVSLWFKLDAPHTGELGFGYRVDGLELGLNNTTKPTDFGAYGVGAPSDRTLRTNYWHHAGFVYSLSNLHFAAYLDGRAMADRAIGNDEPSPLVNLLKPLGGKFRGSLAGIRVWNRAVTTNELLAFHPSAAEVAALEQGFTQWREGSTHKGFRDWCTARIKDAADIGSAGTTSVPDWQALQDALQKAPTLAAHTRQVTAASTLAGAPFCCLEIYPYHYEKRLPHIIPHDARATDTLALVAARGEYESASFVLFPFRDVQKLEFKVSDMAGGQASLPAAAVDLKVVKVWHEPSASWNSYFAGGREFPTLVPELLLNDDSLVKVDEPRRRNYLRVDYPTGSRYVDISASGAPSFNYAMEPVHDSEKLLPLPLTTGRGQQFWVTVCPPTNAAPGDYTAAITVLADGARVGDLRLTLKVLPFELPSPKTHYDLSRDYIAGMMNACGLGGKIAQGKNRVQAEKRLLAEMRDMVRHNCLHPFSPGFENEEDDDRSTRHLEIMKEAGMPLRPIFGGNGCGWGIPMETYTAGVDRALRRYDEVVGHRDVYFYGADEAGPAGVRSEYRFFAYIKKQGARVFVTSGEYPSAGFATDAVDSPACIDRSLALKYHALGTRILSYAAPFTGPENPDIWRRTKGMRLYKADYDGLGEYVWYYGGHNPWNDFGGDLGRYKNFNAVYPTADGVIDTVAWEGFREGFDDVRYATLIKQLAAGAVAAKNPDTVILGKKALVWLELLDPETIDLAAMRTEMIEWILKLRAAPTA